MRSLYFPGLSGLRFIAAAIVGICHIEQVKMKMGHNNWFDEYFFRNAGGLSVTFFFVLSGFLITYLLLVEKEKFSRIDLKGFYMRRVLRIWPLYYLIIFLACFVFPHLSVFDLPGKLVYDDDFSFQFAMLLFILPNVLHVLNINVPYSGQTWSIGVEEQFYLIWPLIFQNIEKYYQVLIGIVLFIVVASNGFLYLANNFFSIIERQSSFWYKTFHFIGTYFTFFRIGAMAIGAIGACLLFTKNHLISFFVKKRIEISSWAILIISFIINIKIPYVNHEFYSLIFIIIILNASSGKSIFHKILENRIFNYLGKLSYGYYMFHAATIVLLMKLFSEYLRFTFDLGETILLNIGVIAFTVFIAGLSYEFFEKKFLRLKKQFKRIDPAGIKTD